MSLQSLQRQRRNNPANNESHALALFLRNALEHLSLHAVDSIRFVELRIVDQPEPTMFWLRLLRPGLYCRFKPLNPGGKGSGSHYAVFFRNDTTLFEVIAASMASSLPSSWLCSNKVL